MIEAGDVKAVLVGHDYVNDFCGNMFGIKSLQWRRCRLPCLWSRRTKSSKYVHPYRLMKEDGMV